MDHRARLSRCELASGGGASPSEGLTVINCAASGREAEAAGPEVAPLRGSTGGTPTTDVERPFVPLLELIHDIHRLFWGVFSHCFASFRVQRVSVSPLIHSESQ